MSRLRQLIREVHRRSLWQVLSVYLVASWAALQVVEIITESAGLPDWAQPFALILLIIGLPIVLATAIVQEGTSGRSSGDLDSPSSEPLGPMASSREDGASQAPPSPTVPHAGSARVGYRLFTWRNAIAGGVAAFAFLGMAVAGYFLMWSTGVGPVGSLSAQGILDEGDPVVLAQFENTSGDQSLGDMVTEALRVDLAGSSILTLVEPNRVKDALRRMGRSGEEILDAELAREVAIRDGFKAVVQGSVGSAGSGYIFVASLVGAETGSLLATFRETARSPDDVIDAIDKLSQDIREKAGESLRVIKAEEPLEEVSTSSLEALRKYAEANRLAEEAEYPRAIAALREAIELDPEFAMAYRKLAVLIQNSGGSLDDQVGATTRAYELRDRLTERERYLAVAQYHNLVTLDLDAEIQAYETVLERYPDDQVALNNGALALMERTRLDEAVAALERAVNGPGASSAAFTNLPGYLAQAGRHEEAEEALNRLEERYPGREIWMAWNRYWMAAFRGDKEATHAAGETLLSLPGAQGGWRAAGAIASIVADVMGGRLDEARMHAERSIQEMKDLGLPSQVLNLELGLIRLELLLDRPEEAMRAYRQVDLDASLDAIGPEVRDYAGVVEVLSDLGLADETERVLRDWKEARIPSSTGPVFEEARRRAEAVLSGFSDPARGLDGLNTLSRDMNCPGCFIWTRARFAQEAGRLEEARNLFLTLGETGSNDYLLGPIRRVMAQERLGEVCEALGESVDASEHYRAFAEAWADADAEFQPRVSTARERALALGSTQAAPAG
jgi:tetratricopeptide (TPR) repeat protein